MTSPTPPPGHDAGATATDTSTDDTPPGATSGADRRGLGSVGEVRRSRDDRMLAGVCGGIARRFDVDPIIVRVLAVVLCFVGLAGLILYVAGWLLLPADDEPRSHLGEWFGLDSPQARDIGLLVAAVLALLAVVGDGGWGSGSAWLFWPVLVLAGPVALVLWLGRRRERAARADGPLDEPAAAASAPWAAAPSDTVVLPSSTTGEAPQAPPAPPAASRPLAPRPPERPREPFSWLPTLLGLSLTAIVLAVLRLVADPTWTAYLAAALAVVGLTLVLSTFTRGGGPLILLGILLVPPLVVGTVVPTLDADDRTVAPTSASQVEASYEQGFGRLVIDLGDVRDPDALAGRRIDVETGAGETVVVVPEGLPVTVEASVSAGDLEVLGERRDGVGQRLVADADGGLDAEPRDTLRVDVDHGLGRVEVRTR